MDDYQDDMAWGPSNGVSVHAGFPNPAAERVKHGAPLSLDFNQHLVKHPSSSYVFRISGHHYASEGIFDGDLALIDRALTPRPIDRVLVWNDNGFSIYRHRQLGPQQAAWGVVTAVIHQYRMAGSPGRDR